MALKQQHIDGIGLVTFQKRRGSRAIRIHVRGDEVKVTLPYFTPYKVAEHFTIKRREWITQNRQPTTVLAHGSYLGKQHTISVQDGSQLRTRVTAHKLLVTLPKGLSIEHTIVQRRLKTAAERVLKQEATDLITPRVSDLALEHQLPHGTISFKKLKTRWGSCDQHGNLIFNIYLIQLPWRLIDYVIAHELAHTKHHNHSQAFWHQVEACLPDYKQRRREMKQHQPQIMVL